MNLKQKRKSRRFTHHSELMLMTLSCFRILQKRQHLIIALICNLCQDFLKNKPMTDSNFASIDPVSAVYNRVSGWLRAYQNDYVIDNNKEPAVI